MKILFSNDTDKYKTEIYFISIIALLFIFRTAIPLFKYPFLVLYAIFIVYAGFNYRIKFISSFKKNVKNYAISIILTLNLFIAFISSHKIYLIIFKDLVSAIILLSIFYIFSLLISSREKFGYFVYSFFHLIVYLAFIVSILGLLDLLDIFHYTDYYSTNDSQQLDYNFALLPEFFGMVGIFYLLAINNSKPQKIIYNLFLIFFFFHIFLSGSRRGLIMLILIVILLIVILILNFFKKDEFYKKVFQNLNIFLCWLLIFPLLLYLYISHTSYGFKNKSLEFIGTKNCYTAQTNTSSHIFRYISVFNNKLTPVELYKKIWSPIFDSKNPDSGWGHRIHRTIFPLTGKNNEIIPKDTKGYLLDSTCIGDYEKAHTYSYTLISKNKVNNGNVIYASVYCFVSEDFNGDRVCLDSEGSINGNDHEEYNFKQRGVWQKLNLEINCTQGEVRLYLYFSKYNVINFSSLKGYVIFAYPQYKITNSVDTSLSFINAKTNSLTNKTKEVTLVSGVKCKSVSETMKGKIQENDFCYFSKNHNGVAEAQSKPIKMMYYPYLQKKYETNIISYSLSQFALNRNIIDKDLIRNWVSKLISEDTTYYPYKSNIVLDTISNSFIGDRVSRWEFALKIFSKEYDWKQKLFGGGFNFLNWYGYYFDKDKTRSDYPHNPFLSILLYSGILGLIVYLIFMYKVFYYYAKYFKEYKILAVFFIITFFFSFFSAGSPFDPPIMGFFVILPFFIHSIHKKKEPKLDDDHINQEIGSIS